MLVIVGGTSRAGRAIAQLWPRARLVTISRAKSGGADGLAVDDYRRVPGNAVSPGCVVINCVGTPMGSLAELEAVNCEVPQAWLHAATAGGARAFLQLSSLSVYGAAEHIDDATPERPQTAYGRTKLAADRALQASEIAATPVALVRIPMLFGAGEDKLSQLVALCRRLGAVPRTPYPVERSMLSYGALAHMIVHLATHAQRGVVHLADPMPFSYDLLAQRLRDAGGKAVRRPIVPALADWLVRTARPMLHARLLRSSRIDPALLPNVSLPGETRLTTALDHLAADSKYC